MIHLQLLIAWLRQPRNDEGAAAVEYALLVGLIAAAVASLVLALGGKVGTIFTNVTSVI